MRAKTVLALATVSAVGLVATAAALAATHGASKQSASVRVTTRTITGLGKVLVNSRGMTLYMFVPDKRKRVTCVSVCAKIWPPLKVAAGAKAVGAGGVKAALLGSDRSPAGFHVVTYNHWPLYTYLGDRKPGAASGQALNLNGGLWYVMSPSGAIIKVKPHASGGGGGGSGGTTTTTKTTTTSTTPQQCSDDDGDGDESAGGPDDGDGCI